MAYELNEREQRNIDVLKGAADTAGGLCRVNAITGEALYDGEGQPLLVDFVALQGRRFLVDKHWVVWRYFPEGSPKFPDLPGGGGAPFRNNCVEMWTGHWLKVEGPDGTDTHKKKLLLACVDERVGGHPGISNIDRFMSQKGYKHPHDPPHAPTKLQIRVLERKQSAADGAIYAKLQEEGLDAAKLMGERAEPTPELARPKRQPKRRTNKRAAKPTSG